MNDQKEICRFCHSSITFDPLTQRWYTLTIDARRFYYCCDDPRHVRGYHLPEGIEFDT